MRLMHDPFEKVRAGTKTVEMRLYDEKRACLRAGDTIVFTDTDSGERMECLVLALHRYATFAELYDPDSRRGGACVKRDMVYTL